MKEDTFTFTARSTNNPEKLAMFTLHNGTVSVQLGNAMLEQVEQAFDAVSGDEKNRFRAWIKPVATGSLQRIIQPIPIKDFDAHVEENSLQTVAWIRAGGLRVAPIMLAWKQVDNPQAAEAFAQELQRRKEESGPTTKLPSIFDYWATWIVAGVLSVVVPIVWLRMQQRRAEQAYPVA